MRKWLKIYVCETNGVYFIQKSKGKSSLQLDVAQEENNGGVKKKIHMHLDVNHQISQM